MAPLSQAKGARTLPHVCRSQWMPLVCRHCTPRKGADSHALFTQVAPLLSGTLAALLPESLLGEREVETKSQAFLSSTLFHKPSAVSACCTVVARKEEACGSYLRRFEHAHRRASLPSKATHTGLTVSFTLNANLPPPGSERLRCISKQKRSSIGTESARAAVAYGRPDHRKSHCDCDTYVSRTTQTLLLLHEFKSHTD